MKQYDKNESLKMNFRVLIQILFTFIVELADGVLSEGVDDWESASALSVLNWSASYVKQPDGIQ